MFHREVLFFSHSTEPMTEENKNPNEGPARWERRGQRLIASTRVLDLTGITYHHPVRKTEREFVCIDAPDWVNVVAVTTEGAVVLVSQFRYGTNDFSLEVPGGVMEKGEDPIEAGLRELAEETGFGGGQARLLGSLHPNPAIQSNRCHVVLVEGVRPIHALDWDPDEEIALSTLPLAQVLERAATGGITHSLSLCALFLYQRSCGPRV